MYRVGDYFKEGGFFNPPCRLAEAEQYKRMAISARLIAFLLWDIVHRVSSPRFFVKEVVLRSAFNVDAKTLRKACAELERAGLLRRIPGKAGSTLSEYWLLHPNTCVPLPEQEGRATPTFNGFSKSKRSAVASFSVSAPSPSEVAEIKTANKKPAPLGASVQHIGEPSRLASGPSPNSEEPERLCRFKNHFTIGYRPDGSRYCGDCHPCSNEPLSRPCKPATKSAFTQPTARDLGFVREEDDGLLYEPDSPPEEDFPFGWNLVGGRIPSS